MTTYAYSLLSQGNAKEALRIMSSLSEEQLSDPPSALTTGFFLRPTATRKRALFGLRETGKPASGRKSLIDKAFANLNSRSRNR